MKKYEVLAERLSVVCRKGSVVIVDDRQYELARAYLKPVEEEAVNEEKTVKKSRKK